jgi:CHASE3 domain
MDRIVPESPAQLFKRKISLLASLATRERIPEAAAVALAIILALAAWLGTLCVTQANLVRHTLEVQASITKVWSLLQDAEIGQRSYILTGDARFLEPFVGVDQRLLGARLDTLAKLVTDNPERSPRSPRCAHPLPNGWSWHREPSTCAGKAISSGHVA